MYLNDFKQAQTFTAFTKDFNDELSKKHIPRRFCDRNKELKEKIVTPNILWNKRTLKLNKIAIEEFGE